MLQYVLQLKMAGMERSTIHLFMKAYEKGLCFVGLQRGELIAVMTIYYFYNFFSVQNL